MVIINEFSKNGRAVPFKNKNSQLLPESVENCSFNMKEDTKANCDRLCKEFGKKCFNAFKNKCSIESYSPLTSRATVIDESFDGINEKHPKTCF